MPDTIEIEQAIATVERLYRSVTGKEAPPIGEAPYAAIPPEKEPERYVEEQVDRLMGLLEPFSVERPAPPAWVPPISIWDTGAEQVICVDLPGVPRSAVSCTLVRDKLVVSGERPVPAGATATAGTGNGACKATWLERPVGTFTRVIVLAPGVLGEQFQAQLKDGVLEIRVPRSSQPPSKAITVQ